MIPLAVNVVQYPAPLGSRCYALGKSVREAIDSVPDNLKVCVFGTGGMSHQLQHERAGLINANWDERFVNLLVNDPDKGSMIEHIEYLREAGSEALNSLCGMSCAAHLMRRLKKYTGFIMCLHRTQPLEV